MTDLIFVAGAYLAALGAIGTYAVLLVRRRRIARSVQIMIDRRREVEPGGRTEPPAR